MSPVEPGHCRAIGLEVQPELLMALATSPAVAKLSPVLPAVTLPVLSAVRVDLLISKVISVPLALAVVPVPLTKPMSLLVLFRVSTLLPFTEGGDAFVGHYQPWLDCLSLGSSP